MGFCSTGSEWPFPPHTKEFCIFLTYIYFLFFFSIFTLGRGKNQNPFKKKNLSFTITSAVMFVYTPPSNNWKNPPFLNLQFASESCSVLMNYKLSHTKTGLAFLHSFQASEI